MAYSVYGDVEAEFKGMVLDTTSPVTDTEVTGFIAQADAEINGLVGLRYVVPITGTDSLIIMKMVSIWLVADRVAKILQVKTKTEENSTAGKSLREMALELLDKIVKGEFLLADATRLSSANGFKSYANDAQLEYTFKKGDTQW